MNVTNILLTMWIVSQGTPFFVVHFRPDNYEYEQLWQPPLAVFIYSDVRSLVKLAQESLKYKRWILIIIGGQHCTTNYLNEIDNTALITTRCSGRSTLTSEDIDQMNTYAEYLVLTRWLIPRETPIDPKSKLMCLVAFDDFTDVPLDYRKCEQRRHLHPGEGYQPKMTSLSICKIRLISLWSVEKELSRFLNISKVFIRNRRISSDHKAIDIFQWLRLRTIDLVLTEFTLSTDRLDQISFTSSKTIDRLQFLSKHRTSYALGSLGLVRIFDVGTWICVGATFISFYVTLAIFKHKDVFIVIIATQLKHPVKVKFRLLGHIMFTSGLLVSCAFSSGLLSSLSCLHDEQITTIKDLLNALQKPTSSVCIPASSYLVSFVNEPGTSPIFRAFARKRHEGKLLVATEEICLEGSKNSKNIISIVMREDDVPDVGRLVTGREYLLTIPNSIPISPGFPLLWKVNLLFGSFNEMHILDRNKELKKFNATMKEIRLPFEAEIVKVLTIRDIRLPLFIIMAAWLVGSVIELYWVVEKFVK